MSEPGNAYRVLARKYRPSTFAELIGQEAMVRTLANAIATGRIAHAFILTGVRGVGKTTTARIIARALNCIGPDGKGGPTVEPCGVCENCRAIAEDRHVDVLEMDAASRTGIDDIRELTDGVRYKPVSARFKVYIIDEVHMLSKPAFNALLKTLEEPPPDVKFVFATTEVHKVPVTVLSRCQRFSLRRVPTDILAAHYAKIALAEKASVDKSALALIARAADGSVRDGLSLLDQALSLAGGKVTEDIVREMLGIADRGLVFDLLETVMKGDAAAALQKMDALYDGGADPAMVLQELLELAYFLTRLKLAPDLGQDDPGYEGERGRGLPLAQKLGMAELSRAWQMLLKGLGEVQTAPSPLQAAEMVLVRLSYVADLPAPAELVKALEGAAPATASPAPAPAPSPRNGVAPRMAASGDGGGGAAPRMQPHEMEAPLPAGPQSFLEVMELFDQRRERILRGHLVNDAHLVRFEAGRIELRLTPAAPRDLPNKLGQLLSQWTGRRWVVSISSEPGEPTLGAQAATREAALRDEAANDPRVRAVLEAFPGARIAEIRESLAETAPLVTINDAAPDIIVDAEDDIL
ncbi:MAG TPA: DNA polymerase III subunit gamma/tau [Stellaceae bacterium]|jgi:DNA polymerase-3 subunit gamma/tau|nr:DNA polymerase III subunit gamma/tau [Stellaceae bacterium]